ncbi:formylglycine-generating enzyme family protein [Desulfoferula mesophila]|uniref:Sulfatase-modifying factor enzyme-like domain-containing protein n=1 Tax=Desulfoferula mesophila TaxID=3058419 RepID=A0AAU9EZR8_9BACT|nr:hypothetical protein FAK_41310 [Desulfoferula mesophilus]
MNRASLVMLVWAAAVLLGGGAAWADIHDPHPQAGDLSLPLPDGARMVFRPVHLGRSMEGLGTRMVWVGRGEGDIFYQTPTQVEISGAFNLARAGSEDWVYYLGKYEVTEAQFYSLMPPPPRRSRSELMKSAQPVTGVSWFQAQEFLKLYNQWLAANAPDKLPRSAGAADAGATYLRLPDEVEWEFAARGGGLIEPSQYFQRTPYGPNQTVVHEWCFPEVVRAPPRVRAVGLKKPHPLGFYDLLGNVAEMTSSLFRVEYTAGRSGGYALRGGSTMKDGAEQCLPSLRAEMPLYKNGKPFTRNDVGLRLVIASLATASRQDVARLKQIYERYGQGGQPVFGVSLGGSQAGWQQLRDTLGRVSPQALKAVDPQLDQLEAKLRQAATKMRKVESDSALVTIRTAVYCLYATYKTMLNEMYLKPIVQMSQSSERRRRAQQNLHDNQVAREESLEQYFAQLDLMDRLYSREVVLGQLEEHRKLLVNQAAGPQKVKINQLLGRHYQSYLKAKQADKAAWVGDLRQALFVPNQASGPR